MAARLARQFGASAPSRPPSTASSTPASTEGRLSADPFDLAGGFILNLQFQYEAA